MGLRIVALLEDPIFAKVVTNCLEGEGHHVSVAASFPKAILLLKNQEFDLIISDVHLENGGCVYDFLKWSKDDPNIKAIKFVLLSVEPSPLAKYLSDGVMLTSRKLGATKYISMDKFDGAHLAKEIASV